MANTPSAWMAVLPSAARTANGDLALSTGVNRYLAVDVDVTAVSGTAPTLTLRLERQGEDGVWYDTGWAPPAVTAAGVVSASVGPGCTTNVVLTDNVRLRWTVGGTSPSFTFSASLVTVP